MRIKYHIIIGAIATGILSLFIQDILLLGIFFLSTWLGDIDHYIYYMITKKFYNPIRCRKWVLEQVRLGNYDILNKPYMLHFVVVIGWFYILSFIFYPFLMVGFGLTLHLVIDLINDYKMIRRVRRII